MRRVSPTVVEIDLQALRYNYRQLAKRVPHGVKILSVVKSNAYGHGAPEVARVLQKEGTDYFGVGTVNEGVELRKARIRRPILILLGIVAATARTLLRYRLTPVISNLQMAEALHRELKRLRRRLPIHVKVDTGMTRLGILPWEFARFLKKLKRLDTLQPAGLLTHFSDAGEERFTLKQERIFESCRSQFLSHFPGRVICHEANSQAVIDRRKLPPGHSMVRLGIALYGSYPLEKARKKIRLRPVLSWKSRLMAVKEVPAGTPVSYGRTFTTKRRSRIGVLPVGYADGYPRILSNRASILLKGKRAPVVGRVCMDMTMVDVTSIPGVRVGDEAVLIGRQGREEIGAEEIASLAGTISYEIFCRIAERIPKI